MMGSSLVVGVASVVAVGFSLVVGSSRPPADPLIPRTRTCVSTVLLGISSLRHLVQKLNFVGRVHLVVGCSPDGTEINGSLR
jgi:hypothetical protein